MQRAKKTEVMLLIPSTWGIHATLAGRPLIWGTFIINSIKNTRVSGTLNFRGTPFPILGNWDERSKEIKFDSPYATFTGHLSIFDDATIKVRHLILSGNLVMKAASAQAGRFGTWVATTDTHLIGPPIKSDSLPPAGVFLTSDLLYGGR